MVPQLKSSLRYGTLRTLSTAVLTAVCSCYSHAPHPGLVRVTDYANGRVIVVELEDLRVEFSQDTEVWIVAELTEEESVCTPVVVSFIGSDGAPVISNSVELRSRAGAALGTSDGDSWHFAHRELDQVLVVEPVWLELSAGEAQLHYDHVFNLRQFVAQVGCASDVGPGPSDL